MFFAARCFECSFTLGAKEIVQQVLLSRASVRISHQPDRRAGSSGRRMTTKTAEPVLPHRAGHLVWDPKAPWIDELTRACISWRSWTSTSWTRTTRRRPSPSCSQPVGAAARKRGAAGRESRPTISSSSARASGTRRLLAVVPGRRTLPQGGSLQRLRRGVDDRERWTSPRNPGSAPVGRTRAGSRPRRLLRPPAAADPRERSCRRRRGGPRGLHRGSHRRGAVARGVGRVQGCRKRTRESFVSC